MKAKGVLMLAIVSIAFSCTVPSPGEKSVFPANKPVTRIHPADCTKEVRSWLLADIKQRFETSGPKYISDDEDVFRLWAVGSSYVNGFVLRGSTHSWEGLFLVEKNNAAGDPQTSIERISLPPGRWQNFYDSMRREGIFELPDQCEVTEGVVAEDAEIVIIETRLNGHYRAVLYNQPWKNNTEEAKRIVSIFDKARDAIGRDIDFRFP